jgi:hypothetical protein
MSQENDSKVQPSTKRLPPNAGKGRVAGVPNKTTKTLKEAILLATRIAGNKIDPEGEDGLVSYLVDIAGNHKQAHCVLLGRVLPSEIAVEQGTMDALQTLAEVIAEGRKRVAGGIGG